MVYLRNVNIGTLHKGDTEDNNNGDNLSQLKKRQDQMLSYFQGVMPGVVRKCSHPH
jgi:hypothetical protein